MVKNHGLLKEEGSEMARGRVATSVALIVWQLHHAAHLTVAAHGPGLFEGSQGRLS